MATKIVKAVRQIGHASNQGVSFPAAEVLPEIRKAYEAAQQEVRNIGGITVGPATVKILIEQEVLVSDEVAAQLDKQAINNAETEAGLW